MPCRVPSEHQAITKLSTCNNSTPGDVLSNVPAKQITRRTTGSSAALPATLDQDILTDASTAAAAENSFVHDVYNAIADHFSDTRYKPWPVVDGFLGSLPAGSLLADVGCGNGKYLGVNPSVMGIGCDRSDALIGICNNRGFESLVADNLSLPFRSGLFDAAISIAVIHHLVTEERRLAAMAEIVRLLRPGGRLLVFVWALEQDKFGSSNTTQDLFVPWKLRSSTPAATASVAPSTAQEPRVFNRFYHLFKSGELEMLASRLANVRVLRSGYDRDNWYIILERQ
ncbi:tRNA methyltransferase [Capsaspora owczarzaki ATCC 30864]|uniref:tRNA methyltransferase n=1 Tax=Capsaspora owczarzaki (strain ATCC 30864) TaxID=595528 RepID=A0A0D2X073_CAPO3|nr:tRNA methyltransferase [Capsaspora owczarzaki ATCC 30864]KJE88559.1 tRNA methyltransferase [Capsaspora owczarzaki ATCC 30864]|eukprot:XP_004365070.1 tRNA methyltransferase [Capsaspora owczarzaki ATCC 30864]